VNGVQILLIIGVGIAVSAYARRRGVEPGLIIVVLAAAASFIPGTPRLELDSELSRLVRWLNFDLIRPGNRMRRARPEAKVRP
jgi:hypothetical protein